MKGIVGKKLGMTQVFDPETGVVTPVTVIEAAPCPVVQVKTADVDGYDAVQIAYDEAAERKVTKPELGHLKKNNVKGAYRHLLELRGQTEAIVGENAEMEVELIQPIAMDKGLRFAIREGGRTVGSGVVTEVIE